MRNSRLSFVCFLNSLVAIWLLWIIGFQNGFIEHGATACSNGSVRSNYMGVKVVDDFVSRILFTFRAYSFPFLTSFPFFGIFFADIQTNQNYSSVSLFHSSKQLEKRPIHQLFWSISADCSQRWSQLYISNPINIIILS